MIISNLLPVLSTSLYPVCMRLNMHTYSDYDFNFKFPPRPTLQPSFFGPLL